MTPRSFSSLVIVGFVLLLAGTVFANVFTDPQAVFRGEVAYTENPNWRYFEYEHYRRDASQIDALILASSRGRALDDNLFTTRSGSRQILSFSVPYGLVSDHLPLLQYVLRDKQGRGERLKAVLLLLDLDLFGKTPWTNTNIDAFLPPALSGESPVRFWWRYLTAFQYGNWRNSLRQRSWAAGRKDRADVVERPILAGLLPTNIQSSPNLRSSVNTVTSEVPARAADDAAAAAHRTRQLWNARRPDLTRQIAYLRQITTICRDNGVALTVATSPMVRANLNGYPPGELEALIGELNRATPIWDFASPPWLADNPGYWVDFSHFSSAVGTMMIDRMFGGGLPVPADFGRLRLQN